MCIFYLFTRWTSLSGWPRWSHFSSGTWSTNKALHSSQASLTLTANESWCRWKSPLIALKLEAHSNGLFLIISKNEYFLANGPSTYKTSTLHTAKLKPFAWEPQSVPTGQLCSSGPNVGQNLQHFFWLLFLFCSLIHFWVAGLMINIQNLWRPFFCLFSF